MCLCCSGWFAEGTSSYLGGDRLAEQGSRHPTASAHQLPPGLYAESDSAFMVPEQRPEQRLPHEERPGGQQGQLHAEGWHRQTQAPGIVHPSWPSSRPSSLSQSGSLPDSLSGQQGAPQQPGTHESRAAHPAGSGQSPAWMPGQPLRSQPRGQPDAFSAARVPSTQRPDSYAEHAGLPGGLHSNTLPEMWQQQQQQQPQVQPRHQPDGPRPNGYGADWSQPLGMQPGRADSSSGSQHRYEEHEPQRSAGGHDPQPAWPSVGQQQPGQQEQQPNGLFSHAAPVHNPWLPEPDDASSAADSFAFQQAYSRQQAEQLRPSSSSAGSGDRQSPHEAGPMGWPA